MPSAILLRSSVLHAHAATLGLACAITAHAGLPTPATAHWAAPISGNWLDDANWNGPVPFNASTHAIIDADGAYTVTLDNALFGLASLTLDAPSATLAIGPTTELFVTDLLAPGAGRVNIARGAVHSSAQRLETNRLDIGADSALRIDAGHWTVRGDSAGYGVVNNGVLDIRAGATLTLEPTNPYGNLSTPFSGAGTIRLEGGAMLNGLATSQHQALAADIVSVGGRNALATISTYPHTGLTLDGSLDIAGRLAINTPFLEIHGAAVVHENARLDVFGSLTTSSLTGSGTLYLRSGVGSHPSPAHLNIDADIDTIVLDQSISGSARTARDLTTIGATGTPTYLRAQNLTLDDSHFQHPTSLHALETLTIDRSSLRAADDENSSDHRRLTAHTIRVDNSHIDFAEITATNTIVRGASTLSAGLVRLGDGDANPGLGEFHGERHLFHNSVHAHSLRVSGHTSFLGNVLANSTTLVGGLTDTAPDFSTLFLGNLDIRRLATLAPGGIGDLGSIALAGDLIMTNEPMLISDGAIHFDILAPITDDTASATGSRSDRISVTNAYLKGRAIIDVLGDSSLLALGDEFVLISANSSGRIEGRFDQLIAPDLADGLFFALRYDDNAVRLVVVPAPGAAATAFPVACAAIGRRRRRDA